MITDVIRDPRKQIMRRVPQPVRSDLGWLFYELARQGLTGAAIVEGVTRVLGSIEHPSPDIRSALSTLQIRQGEALAYAGFAEEYVKLSPRERYLLQQQRRTDPSRATIGDVVRHEPIDHSE